MVNCEVGAKLSFHARRGMPLQTLRVEPAWPRKRPRSGQDRIPRRAWNEAVAIYKKSGTSSRFFASTSPKSVMRRPELTGSVKVEMRMSQ